jgi:hypothetical protein
MPRFNIWEPLISVLMVAHTRAEAARTDYRLKSKRAYVCILRVGSRVKSPTSRKGREKWGTPIEPVYRLALHSRFVIACLVGVQHAEGASAARPHQH